MNRSVVYLQRFLCICAMFEFLYLSQVKDLAVKKLSLDALKTVCKK